MSSYKFLSYEQNEGIGILKINREDKLNALNQNVIEEMISFFEKLRDIPLKELRGLVLTGSGSKAFIAGADIASMQDLNEILAADFAKKGQKLTELMEGCHLPIVAAVNGYALGGGCEMAMACDFILASSSAIFGLPEVSLGLIPGFGGTQRLARLVGSQRAKEIMFSARLIKAEEAKSIGLCLDIVDGDVIEASIKLINSFSKNSPLAISKGKLSLNQGIDLEMTRALEVEAEQFGSLFNSEDTKEGIAAFLEKRKASFEGK